MAAQARYAVAALIGGIIFTLVGFFAENSSAGAEGGYGLKFYLSEPGIFQWYWWLLAGFAVGAGLLYLFDTKGRE